MFISCHSLIVAWFIPAVLALQPRTTAYTNSTSTTTPYSAITPQATPQTCRTNCTINEVPLRYQFWAKHSANGTPQAPKDQTDSAGTSTAVVTYFNGSTTTVAYPTPFWDYRSEYNWAGVIHSGSGTHSACVTATPTPYAFGSSHPPYPTSIYPNSGEEFGEGYELYGFSDGTDIPAGLIDANFIQSAFPDQLASLVFASCSQEILYLVRPPFALGSVSGPMITTSSTSESIIPTGVMRLPSAPTLSAASPANTGASSNSEASTATGGIFALSEKVSLPSMPTPTPSPVGGQALTTDPPKGFVIGTQTVVPGAAITVAGVPVSLAPSQSFIVVGTATEEIAIASAGAILIGGQALTSGGVVTIAGVPVSQPSLLPEILEVEGSSILPTAAPPQPSQIPEMISFMGQSYTMNSASDLIIAGQTLTPGGVITVSGTPISLPAGASYIVEGTSTATFIAATPAPEVVTIGGQTYTMNSASDFVIGSRTLIPGGVITISGTPVSLAVTLTDIVVGTSTERLAGLITSGTQGSNGPAPTATHASTAANTTGRFATCVIAGLVAGIVAAVVGSM